MEKSGSLGRLFVLVSCLFFSSCESTKKKCVTCKWEGARLIYLNNQNISDFNTGILLKVICKNNSEKVLDLSSFNDKKWKLLSESTKDTLSLDLENTDLFLSPLDSKNIYFYTGLAVSQNENKDSLQKIISSFFYKGSIKNTYSNKYSICIEKSQNFHYDFVNDKDLKSDDWFYK